MNKTMTLEEIRDRRCDLENEIGRMIRKFESETSVLVSSIAFVPVEVVPEGQIIGPERAQSRDYYECMLQVCV